MGDFNTCTAGLDKDIKNFIDKEKNAFLKDKSKTVDEFGNHLESKLKEHYAERKAIIKESQEVATEITERIKKIASEEQGKIKQSDILYSFLEGSTKFFKGARENIYSKIGAEKSKVIGNIHKALNDISPELENLIKKDRGFSDRIETELARLNGDKVQSTNDNLALKVAKALQENLEALRNQVNDTALRFEVDGKEIIKEIKKLTGWHARQTHNKHRITNAGFETWYKFLEEGVDFDKTLKGLPPVKREAVFKEIYEQITKGKKIDISEIESLKGFINDDLKNFVESRILHFKDVGKSIEYDKMFGANESILEKVYRNTDALSKEYVLRRSFGSDRDFTFGLILKELGNAERVNERKLKDAYKLAIGEITLENDTIAKVFRSSRNLVGTSILGHLFLSSITDIPSFTARVLQREGFGGMFREFFTNWGGLAKQMFKQAGFTGKEAKKEVRNLAYSLGVGLNGVRRLASNHLDEAFTDNLTKTDSVLKGLTNTFYKWNLANFDTDVKEAFITFQNLGWLGKNSRFDFEKLPRLAKTTIEAAGFKKEEWEVLRSLAKHDKGLDAKIINPNEIGTLSDDKIKTLLKKQDASEREVRLAKYDLENKLRGFLQNDIEQTMHHKTARITRMMGFGDASYALKSGNLGAEMYKTALQLKTYSVAFISDTWGSLFKHPDFNAFEKLGGVVAIGSAMAISTQASLWLKDIAKGRTPRDITAKQNLLDLIAMSGLGGVYGDLAMTQLGSSKKNKFFAKMDNREALLNFFAGPTFSKLLISPVTNLTSGNFSELKGDIIGNIPFGNLFYLDWLKRAGTNALFLTDIELAKMDRRMQEEMGQERWNTFFD